MNVVLIPFFLVARVAVDEPWEYGPEFIYDVEVHSTAIPAEESSASVRLHLASRLICQPKGPFTLSCHFRDSNASSYVTRNVDPRIPAIPITKVIRQEAYEISQDQFEIRFNKQGLANLVVNENIQPRELDMIRAIVEQLNIAVDIEDTNEDSFEVMENFTQGECVTIYTLDRKILGRSLYAKRGYVLETPFGLKDGQLLQIRKIRNLHMCTHTVPYFFGSSGGIVAGDVFSTINSWESNILITTTELISSVSNAITASKISEGIITTLYENITLRLETIVPATSLPPEMNNSEIVSTFIGRWPMDSSSEEDR